jgi:hypothetical protein
MRNTRYGDSIVLGFFLPDYSVMFLSFAPLRSVLNWQVESYLAYIHSRLTAIRTAIADWSAQRDEGFLAKRVHAVPFFVCSSV